MTDLVANLIGGKALHRSAVAHICVLTRSIVGRLALIEESTPVFAFPKGLILLEMLVEKSVDCHIVAGDVKSHGSRVDVPSHAATHAVVGSPNPEMVADDVRLSDLQRAIHMDGRRAETSDTEEQVGKQRRVVVMTLAAPDRK